MAFLCCTRTLLPREVGNLKCCFAVNRIKQSYYYHQSLSKNILSYHCDSVKRQYTRVVKSKDCDGKDQSVINDHNIYESDININEKHEGSKMKAHESERQNNSLEQTSGYSRQKQSQTVSRYRHFKQSWLNYYSSVTQNSEHTGQQNHLQTKSLLEEKVRMDAKDKSRKTFGNLSIKVSNESQKPDERNPNERIDEEMKEDSDERRDRRLNIPLSRYGRIGKTSYFYTRKMSIMGRQGKVKEAIAIFEDWMMIRDRVMPSKRTFVVLIGILGRVGYVQKAFDLFRKMGQLGLDPEDHIFTSLFNACANSPFPDDGLRYAEYLLNYMKQKGIHPNLFSTKAAMKAFAISGDFSRVFTLLDETSKRLELDEECFHHLLIACISDKEAGFRRALQVWQKMRHCRLQPNTITFNLLIRTARDCGIGDSKTFDLAFGQDSDGITTGEGIGLLVGVNHSFDGRMDTRQNLSLHSSTHLTDSTRKPELEVTGSKMNIYSSISPQPPSICSDGVPTDDYKYNAMCNSSEQVSVVDLSNHVSVKDMSNGLTYPENNDKNGPLGAGDKPLEHNSLHVYTTSAASSLTNNRDNSKSMYSHLLTKDTSSILIEGEVSKLSVKDLKFPSGRFSFLGGANKFISFMEAMGAQPDLKTFSQILACIPNDEQSEFQLLLLMEKRGVRPDIDFFNDIMMRRNSRKESAAVKAVLTVISQMRLVPNMRTYAALSLTCRKEAQAHQFLQDMKDANLEPNSVIMRHLIYISLMNFTYKLKMLKEMESLGLKATQQIIVTIEKSIAVAKAKIIEAEKNDSTSYFLSEPFQRSFQYFLRYYKKWLIQTELDKPRHAWDAFQPSHQKQEKEGLVDKL